MNKEYLLNKKHEQGNTALHLASWKKTRPVIEDLLGSINVSPGFLEVNAGNHSGLTPLSTAYFTKRRDREIIEILLGAGAMKARDIYFNQNPFGTSTTIETWQSQPDNMVEYFQIS
ncbi:hypothetical protein NC653_029752 [Populus alba x Populus x berolinensis]|uniref:Ankyrin repeat family protein n=1 Tax=Populus alba x Populus x berolinensis TaxID=444605 RepID=A0AAD6Q5L6_9ROSI|nr:hypothetical protein NC653_029752 [Populus alba x Populus x berolinensis]